MYNGETADDIAKRKRLRYREDILDNMGSEELAANLFRITQTEARLKRDKVNTENKAMSTKSVSDVTEELIELMMATKNNAEFLDKMSNFLKM